VESSSKQTHTFVKRVFTLTLSFLVRLLSIPSFKRFSFTQQWIRDNKNVNLAVGVSLDKVIRERFIEYPLAIGSNKGLSASGIPLLTFRVHAHSHGLPCLHVMHKHIGRTVCVTRNNVRR
jgi:hypothetical protein